MFHSRDHQKCTAIDKLCQEATRTNARINLSSCNWFHSLSFQQVQALLTLFPKSFSSFPHATCLLSASSLYLALDEIYHPLYAPIPRNVTLRSHAVRIRAANAIQDSHPHWCSFPRGFHLHLMLAECLNATIRSQGFSFKAELLPVHSPILRESCLVYFPLLTYMLKFSRFADLTSCLNNITFISFIYKSWNELDMISICCATIICSTNNNHQVARVLTSTEPGILPRITQKCNTRSTFHWFTEFCNSQWLSHFAAFFIDAWAEISIAESCGKGKCTINAYAIPAVALEYAVALSNHTPPPPSSGHRVVNSKAAHTNRSRWQIGCANDPSAGSPTETLLRLLLPLSDKVH